MTKSSSIVIFHVNPPISSSKSTNIDTIGLDGSKGMVPSMMSSAPKIESNGKTNVSYFLDSEPLFETLDVDVKAFQFE